MSWKTRSNDTTPLRLSREYSPISRIFLTRLGIFAKWWSLVEQQTTVVLDYEMQPVRHTHIGTFLSRAAHYSTSKLKVDIANHANHRGSSTDSTSKFIGIQVHTYDSTTSSPTAVQWIQAADASTPSSTLSQSIVISSSYLSTLYINSSSPPLKLIETSLAFGSWATVTSHCQKSVCTADSFGGELAL